MSADRHDEGQAIARYYLSTRYDAALRAGVLAHSECSRRVLSLGRFDGAVRDHRGLMADPHIREAHGSKLCADALRDERASLARLDRALASRVAELRTRLIRSARAARSPLALEVGT